MREIRAKNILDYIEHTFPEPSNKRTLAECAFVYLQKYLDMTPRQEFLTKDIASLITFMKEKIPSSSTPSPSTIENYLGQFARFFEFEDRFDLAETTRERQRFYHKLALKQNKYAPIWSNDLKKLYELADAEDKVLIRLLLFEDKIPIERIAQITYREDSGERIFYDNRNIGNEIDSHVVKLDCETVEIINDLINANEAKKKGRFLHFSTRRQVSTHIEVLREIMKANYGLKYDIYPKTLRMFAREVHKEDLHKWLSDKPITCPKCGHKFPS